MKKIDEVKLDKNASIKEALQIIGNGAIQIAIILDNNGELYGTLSDGDIRRGLLNGLNLDSPISSIIFKNPTCAKISHTKDQVIQIAVSKKINQIPIINEDGKVLGIKLLNDLIKPENKKNKVILMVGGLGLRLRPYTNHTPKPMLKVGNKPILEIILENFLEYGYSNFIMCTNYKSEVIKDYFGDGKKFGVKIEYIIEKQRMGTAGALSLLREKPDEPFFVMNGDLLTTLNFEHLHNFHISNNSEGTMCVREYNIQIPFGVVNIENDKINSIEEKPTKTYFVNAGIYMLNPSILEYVPTKKPLDMPTLFEQIIKNKNASVFPLREYWTDIGHTQEYFKANEDFEKVF